MVVGLVGVTVTQSTAPGEGNLPCCFVASAHEPVSPLNGKGGLEYVGSLFCDQLRESFANRVVSSPGELGGSNLCCVSDIVSDVVLDSIDRSGHLLCSCVDDVLFLFLPSNRAPSAVRPRGRGRAAVSRGQRKKTDHRHSRASARPTCKNYVSQGQ